MEATLQWTCNTDLNGGNYFGNSKPVLQIQLSSHNVLHKMFSKFGPTMLLQKLKPDS